MSWAEVSDLHNQGHTIGAHGWSHALLTHCDDAALSSELTRSRQTLEDRLGAAVTSISMPGGRWNTRILRACAAAGYTRVFNSNPFQKPVEMAGVRLAGRIMLRRTTTREGLHRILAAEERTFSALRVQHALKAGVRSILGDRLYQGVWSLVGSAASRQELSP
jgi:peptidoglycan/xylan/chitin deacetylase (PgdA/CDA1 family)